MKLKCIALILAGGHGKRLGALTNYYSKPAIPFGGKTRLIDFSLNNCIKSGIKTIGVLSQYFTSDLNTYINNIYGWRPEEKGVYTLTPKNEKSPYCGTADAVYRNMEFIDKHDSEYVLILSGDHIYDMDYQKMIDFHKKTGAELTIASTTVPIREASRFGVMETSNSNGRVSGFEEKPLRPKNNLVSMGIYLFKWRTLRKYLLMDCKDVHSRHDFGQNIFLEMLSNNEAIYAYRYDGYWRDVGTVDSLWEANMDQIANHSNLRPEQNKKDIINPYEIDAFNTISHHAEVRDSIISEGCVIFGKVGHSILSNSVTVCADAEVENSVLMPGVYIGNNVKIYNTVVGSRAKIMDNTIIGSDDGIDYFVDHKVCSKGISLIEPWLYVDRDMELQKNSQVCQSKMDDFNLLLTQNAI